MAQAGNPRSVLLVCQSENTLGALAAILHQADEQALTAQTAKDAWDCIKMGTVACVVQDLTTMGGEALTAALAVAVQGLQRQVAALCVAALLAAALNGLALPLALRRMIGRNAIHCRNRGNSAASAANWFSPALPARRGSGKLSAISWRHSTSKSARSLAAETMRAGSTRPSTPRHHCTFHVIRIIECPPA